MSYNPKSLLQLSLQNVEKQIKDINRISNPSDAPRILGISKGQYRKMKNRLPDLEAGVSIAKTGMIGKGYKNKIKGFGYITTASLNLPVNYYKY
tara:strand:+ start:47 stop:328 length:282 start_codon:yes stop_codon:yes gene_type:complete